MMFFYLCRSDGRCPAEIRGGGYPDRPRMYHAARGRGENRAGHENPDTGRKCRLQLRSPVGADREISGRGDAVYG